MRKFLTLFVTAVLAFSVSALNLNLEGKQLQLHEQTSVQKKAQKQLVVKGMQKKVNAKTPLVKKKAPVAKAPSAADLAGTWTFDLGDYYFQTSVGQIQVEFEATVEGNVVFFDDPSGNELPFVGVFDAATSTLTFDRQYLGFTGTYYVYQEPYVYNWDTDDLDYQPIVAQYYDYNGGILLFDMDNGIEWGAYSDQNGNKKLGSFSIYDFEGATNGSVWTAMENGKFNENVIYGTFQGKENTVISDVEVFENTYYPGIYKIRDPFKALYAELKFNGTSPEMVIDATDPDNVKVEMQSTGITGGTTTGTYYYFNEGWYCDQYGDELDPSLVCTLTNENGNITITFPYHSFTLYAPNAGQFYYGSAYESKLTFTDPNAQQTPAEPELVGEYNVFLQPVAINGATQATKEVTLAVYSNGEEYFFTESSDTNSFFGQDVKFVYNDATGQATFNAAYAGEIEGKYAWLSAFVFNGSITEPQEKYGVGFTVENGFDFPEAGGLGFFETTAADDFNAQDLIAGYYFLKEAKGGEGEGGEQPGEGNYPESLAAFAGVHTFTADVTFEEAYNISTITDYLKKAVEFEIEGASLSNFIGSGKTIGLTYDNQTGTITLGNNVLGSTMDYNTYQGWDFGYADAEGNWKGLVGNGGEKPVWQVTEDGHIIIPDFTVVDYRSNPAKVVAHYKNVKVDGYPEEEGGEGNYPESLAAFAGVHSFTANVAFEEAYNISTITDYLKEAVEFEIEGASLSNFIGSGKTIGLTYDNQTGAITLGNNVLGSTMDYNTYQGWDFGYADAEGNWKGLVGNGGEKPVWQVTEDGHIIIPDFTVVDYRSNPAKVVARYSNVKVDGYPEAEPEVPSFDITGNLTSQLDMNQGMTDEPELLDPETIEVAASYADGKLTINMLAEGLNPITFNVDVENGTAASEEEVISSEDEVDVDYVLTYYYTDVESQKTVLNAKLYATEDGKTLVEVAPWGEAMDFPGYGMFFNNAYYNTSIVLDYAIEGLPTKSTEVVEGNIEGYWSIPLNGHYQGSYSLKAFTGTYEATIDANNVVTFAESDNFNIVGTLTENNELIITRAMVLPAGYARYQIPYINNSGTNELEELAEETVDAIIAKFDPVENTLTFPENSGLLYGRFDSQGKLSFWDDAFDFNGIGRKTGEFVPEMKLGLQNYQIGVDNVTVNVEIETVRFDVAKAAAWKAVVTESFSDKVAEKDWTETKEFEATVEGEIATFTITDLAQGNHDFKYAIVACNEDGEALLTSNEKALSVVVGPSILIRAPKSEVGVGSVSVSFDATLQGFDTEKASYQVKFVNTDTKNDDEGYAGDEYFADATIDGTVASATLTGLDLGVYNFTVALVAYDENDAELAISNNLTLSTITITEVEQPEEPITSTDKAHFAYELNAAELGEGQYSISFTSTGAAANAYMVVTDPEGTVVDEYEIGSVNKGENTFTYDASDLYKDLKYNWAIRVHNYPVEETVISDAIGVGGSRAGIATFTDPEFPEVLGYTVVGRTQNGGIDVYNPEGELIRSAIYKGCAAMGNTNTSSPMDATTRGTEVYLASWGDASHGVVAFDLAKELLEEGSAEPYSVFEGTKENSGKIVNEAGEGVGSGTPCVGVWGTGEETTIITFDEDIFANKLAMNVIGNAKTTSNAAQLIGNGFNAQLANTNVGVATTKGGFFASQCRANGMEETTSGLRYFARTEDGNFDSVWKVFDQAEEDANLLPSALAGVGITRDESKVVVPGYDAIYIYDVTWNGNVPSLSNRVTLNNPYGRQSTRTNVRFDVAGNLHVTQQVAGYYVITLANEEHKATTAAPSTLAIAGTNEVSNIAVDADDTNAVYYNVNGVQVDGRALVPGVYVKVVGKTATKVVVK